MKIGIEEIGPFIYNALRLIIVALLCWLWLYKTHTYRKMPWRDLKYLILLALGGFCLTQVCLTFGLSKTTAGNASLVSSYYAISSSIIK